jgi:glucose/arabinose dehydrogenase
MHPENTSTPRRLVRTGAVCGALIAAAFGLSACDHGDPARQAAQYGAAPMLPTPKNYLLPPMKVAPVGTWKQGEAPVVDASLKIAAFATGLVHPRSLYMLPNGDILIVEANGPAAPVNRPKDMIMGAIQGYGGSNAKGANRITLVRPGADGAPAQQTVFLENLSSPFGVALVGNDLYVANADSLMKFPYNTGDTHISAPGTKVIDLPGGPINHHWTKSLLASEDGAKLYVGVGSNSNIVENGLAAEKDRADVLEVDRATGATRIFAAGLRNPNGLSWEPTTKALWVVVNERDEIGPDLVPDYLTSVKDGAFYGWPYSYYGQHVDKRVMPQRPDLVAKAIAPDYALGSHVAPLGLVFNSAASSMPEKLRAGAFVGEHGSWDRSPMSGYKVVFVPFNAGKPAGQPVDVVTGFLVGDHAKGRPVGLAMDKTGSLLIADDIGNTVWRVSAAGGAAAPAPSAAGAP